MAERLREVQWLETQYDQFDSSLVQGRFDERSQRSFKAQFEVGVQEAVGNVFAPTADGTASRVPVPSSGLATPGTGEFADSATPDPGPVSATNIERLEDRLAYRQRISEAIRDQMLDDAHDLEGLVMRELGFDLTLTPAERDQRRAIVVFELDACRPEPSELERLKPLLQRRLDSEGARLHQRVRELKERLEFRSGKAVLRDKLSPEDCADLLAGEAAIRADLVRTKDSSGLQLLDSLKLLWLDGSNDGLATFDQPTVELAHRICAAWGLSIGVGRRLDKLVATMPSELGAATTWIASVQEVETKKLQIEGARTAFTARAVELEVPAAEARDFSTATEALSERAGSSNPSELARIAAGRADLAMRWSEIVDLEREQRRVVEEEAGARAALLESLRSLQPTLSDGWQERLIALADASKVSVTQVRPSNVTEAVSARTADRRLTDIAVRLGYLTGSFAADAAARAESEVLLRAMAMERFPTLVGFGDGSRRFGWVLGPSYSAPRLGEEGSFLPQATHSVSARAVFPALAVRAELHGRRAWICANGKLTDDEGERRFSLSDFVHGVECGDPLWDADKQVVSLPPDAPALESALGALVDAARKPLIVGVSGDLREGAGKQTILIEGDDLWRNPEVYAAGRKATSVAVTADMRGLLAEFTDFLLPSPKVGKSEGVELRVVTSTGSARYEGKLTVHRDGPVSPFVKSLVTKFVVSARKTVEFDVDPAQFPGAYDSLSLRMRPRGANEWWEPACTESRPSPNRLQFVLSGDAPVAKWAGAADPYELTVDVRLKSRPAADPVSVPGLDASSLRWFDKPGAFAPLQAPGTLGVDVAGEIVDALRLVRSTGEEAAGAGPFTAPGAAYRATLAAASGASIEIKLERTNGAAALVEIPAAELKKILPASVVRPLIDAKNPASVKLELKVAELEGAQFALEVKLMRR